MFNILICDDDISAINHIKDILNAACQRHKIGVEINYYTNPLELKQKISMKKFDFDILLLDIDMPEITGIEIAEILRNAGYETIIIFISAHEEFVYKAIEYQPFRYIRKVCMEAELPIAIQSAVKQLELKSDAQIIINTNDGDLKISILDIVFYETGKNKRKVTLYMKDNRTIEVNATISEMMGKIDRQNYIMIHRSCVVNADYVKRIHNYIVELDTGEKQIVSRTRYKDVRIQFLRYWGEII